MTGSGCGGCSGGAFYLVGGGVVLPRSTSSVGMMTLREPSTGPVVTCSSTSATISLPWRLKSWRIVVSGGKLY